MTRSHVSVFSFSELTVGMLGIFMAIDGSACLQGYARPSCQKRFIRGSRCKTSPVPPLHK